MPSSTPKQAKFMRAVAHGWTPDKAPAPPVSVAKDFMRADQKLSGSALAHTAQKLRGR